MKALYVFIAAVLAATAPDRASSLVGTWSCQSLAHTISTMVFTRESDGAISMSNRYRTADDIAGEYDETYRYDPQTSLWTWSATDSNTQESAETGTAGPWASSTWTFKGTRSVTHAAPQRIRMIYTSTSDASFRREFDAYRNGAWSITSSSVCKRTGS